MDDLPTMKCRRAFDADLLAVLRGEGDPAFLAHYPSCPDCAAEVRVWGELDGLLRAGAPLADVHPEPEVLLAFVDAPVTLGADVRGGIERHVAACRICADEMRTLETFHPEQVLAAADAPRVADAPVAVATAAPPAVGAMRAAPAPPVVEAPTSGSWLGRLVWHPVFAYALVAVLLVPVLWNQMPQLTQATRAVDARRDLPALPAAQKPAPNAEHDAAPPPPGAMLKEERGAGLLADAGRPEPQAVAKSRAGAEAPAAAPPPAQPAMQRRAADDLTDNLPALRARSKDAESAPTSPEEEARPALAGRATERLARAEPGAAKPAGTDAPIVLEVVPNSPTIFAFADAARATILRIVPTADLPQGPLDVTVRSRAGQHELHVRVTDRADAIAVPIPAHWLAAGDYVMTLQPVGERADRANGAPVLLGFTVRAP